MGTCLEGKLGEVIVTFLISGTVSIFNIHILVVKFLNDKKKKLIWTCLRSNKYCIAFTHTPPTQIHCHLQHPYLKPNPQPVKCNG